MRIGGDNPDQFDPREIELDQFWECPKCGSQIATGPPATAHPPKCTFGHSTTEMEQVTAERWGT